MLFEKQNVKVVCFTASRAETKCDLKISRTRAKELASRTILNVCLREAAITRQSVGVAKVQGIIPHMKMLNFALKVLTNFSKNLVQGQKDALSIASIRLDTMRQGT